MLVIGSDKLGEIVERGGERGYPIPGVLVEVSGWRAKLYALYFLPDSMRIWCEPVHQAYDPNLTKPHMLGGSDNESSTVIVAGHIFVIDVAKRHPWNDLRFRWINPNG